MAGLFRDEVVRAQRGQWLGTINAATPLAFFWWVLLAVALAAVVICMLAFGHYTRQAAAQGKLEQGGGGLAVTAPTAGAVSLVLVGEGHKVERDQPLLEISTAGSDTILRAARAGVVADLAVRNEQQVTLGQALLTLLPPDTRLYARMAVPGNAIGYVQPGARVALRYQAFPYQEYGQQWGTVMQAVNNAPIAGASAQDAAATLYPVLVALDRQSIRVRGEDQPLQAGMLLDANIQLERRYLRQWVFEPLFRLQKQQVAGNGAAL